MHLFILAVLGDQKQSIALIRITHAEKVSNASVYVRIATESPSKDRDRSSTYGIRSTVNPRYKEPPSRNFLASRNRNGATE